MSSIFLKLPVIGIPSWKWKRKLRRLAENDPSIITVPVVADLCYETSRHFQLLKYFDDHNTKYAETEYYKFNKENEKDKKYIAKKILGFKNLYISIKGDGYKNITYPILTDDGCRLDGSHRLSILVHLGIESVDLNIVRYEDFFSKEKSASIRQNVIGYRKKVYNLS